MFFVYSDYKGMKTLATLSILLFISISAYAKNENTSTFGGRFQLIQLSDARRDQYLLDTQTGKMWNPSCFVGGPTDCVYSAWTPVDVQGISASLSEMRQRVKEAEEAVKKSKDSN